VTFNAPINTSSVAAGAITLTDNGNPVAVSGLTFTLVGGTTSTYAVGDLTPFTEAVGSYVFTVNADDIDDPYGNPGTGSLSTSWLTNTPLTASATFLKPDTTTQGNWIGVYGTDGYDIVANPSTTNPNDLPAGVTVTPAGQTSYTWANPAPATATRALEVPPSGTTRIAACWYSGTSFTVDVDVSSGSYNLELNFLDYDGSNARSEQIQFSNASTGTVLSTQTVSSFSNGAYMDYTISGNVLITITKETGPNAVLSGLFFDPDPPA
jgi:hypothetical protein